MIFFFPITNEMKNNNKFIEENIADICCSVQGTIIDILISKLKKAAASTGITHIGIAGGVSANSGLREALRTTGEQMSWKTYIPDFQYCTDNAGMIGIAGYYKYLENQFADQSITPQPRLAWN